MDNGFSQIKALAEDGTAIHGDDKSVYAEFEIIAVKNEFKSEQEGRPIFEDVPHVKIMFPGDKNKMVHRPVRMVSPDGSTPSDIQRWPNQWARFKAQEEQRGEGTPLSEWPPLTKSEVMELRGMNIHTVEALALLPDGNLNWLGARDMREKAKLWLDKANGGKESTRLLAENEALRNDVDVLKRQFAELAALKNVDPDSLAASQPKPRSAKPRTTAT